MLPISEAPPFSKPKSPVILDRKHSSYLAALKPYLSLHHRRTWFFLAVLLLQLLLLLSAPSLPFSFSPSANPTATLDTPITTAEQGLSRDDDDQLLTKSNQAINDNCPDGKVYIYDLPSKFNTDIARNCRNLNPWSSRCDALSNSGFGKRAGGALARILPEKVAGAWFWTDQFSLEVIFHNRMLNYRCRTLEPQSAAAFYIPFYTGLAVEKHLFTKNSTFEERDRDCKEMLDWVSNQPLFTKSNGWDHFIAVGRISWDFRRSKDSDWGSSCIYLPEMRNITRFLIERNPWDYFDVAVPYPTGFHPGSVSELRSWQDFVKNRQRNTLFCFAGATRGFIKNDFRGILLNQCYSEPGSCRVLDCGGSKCANGSSAILETFLDSDFCLQPRGDSFTRRSVFDCMLAGSVPVLFWHRTAYLQYEWFLPGEPESYSVFIDRNEVKNGTSIKGVLEKISREKVKRMREKVIEYIPKIMYANSNKGLDGVEDAFDVAVDGFLKRVKKQEGEYKWR